MKGIGYFCNIKDHPTVNKIEEVCGFHFENIQRKGKIHLLQYLAEIVESEYGEPDSQITMLVEELQDMPMNEQTAIEIIKALVESL